MPYIIYVCISMHISLCVGGRLRRPVPHRRTGKVLLPKTGFLRCVTDACLDRVVQDAIIVPISLGACLRAAGRRGRGPLCADARVPGLECHICIGTSKNIKKSS